MAGYGFPAYGMAGTSLFIPTERVTKGYVSSSFGRENYS
jgi:hypothetical protein